LSGVYKKIFILYARELVFEVLMRWLLLFAFALRVFSNSFDQVTPSSPEDIASLNADLLEGVQ
jgi:hypothetical protein